MNDEKVLWLAVYRAVCMIKEALAKFLGLDKK